MEKSTKQIEKNVSASFGYVKKDMLMLNDAFSDLHDKVQHLSLNHATLLEEIRKLRADLVTEKKISPTNKKTTKKKDDLTKIEGIGPAIRDLLYKNKITTFNKLSKTPIKKLRILLEKGGTTFKLHDPSTWARQSSLAAREKWVELEKLQKKLAGGVKRPTPKKKTPVKKKVIKETITYA